MILRLLTAKFISKKIIIFGFLSLKLLKHHDQFILNGCRFFFKQQDMVNEIIIFIHFFLFMQQSNQKQIMDVLYANNVEERKFSQIFTYNNVVVTHEHTINVQIRPERVEELLIRNFYPKVSQNQVIKVIQISLENKIIKITDIFTSSVPQNIIKEPLIPLKNEKPIKNPTRVQLLNKRFTKNKMQQQTMGNQQNIRDIKNVVKNIIRIFQSWLQQNQDKLQNVSIELLKLLEGSKLNNNLIIKLSKNQLIRRYFLHFCKNYGQEWINKSKIHDKQSHLQVLRKYEVIFYEAQDGEGQLNQNLQPQQNGVQLLYEEE